MHEADPDRAELVEPYRDGGEAEEVDGAVLEPGRPLGEVVAVALPFQ